MDFENISLQGEIDAHKLLRIAKLAKELELNVIAPEVVPAPITELVVADTVSTETMTIQNNLESGERTPARRIVTKASFQAFGFEATVDKTADAYSQRSKKGNVSGIWRALAQSQFTDRTYFAEVCKVIGQPDKITLPIRPEQVIGVPLPTFGFVSTQQDTYRSNDRTEPAHNIKYVKPSECDNLDLDGLAKYVVAAAGHIQELSGIYSLNSKQATRQLKTFIPDGLGLQSMSLLADFCAQQLRDDAESAVSNKQMADATATFASFSK